MVLTSEKIEARVAYGMALFRQGYNCSQSVFAACADLYGIADEAFALRIAASFGGGIGRMRQTCGAACGMFLLAGLENGCATAGDAEGKKQNYALVQSLAGAFKAEHGSLICAELLGLAPRATNAPTDPTPAPRTEEYYKKRPCVETVGNAIRIYLTEISQRDARETLE